MCVYVAGKGRWDDSIKMYHKETVWEVWAGFIWLRIRKIIGLFCEK
jgi:hypothetical protein